MGDPNVRNIFYACVEGTAEEYTCSPGLRFDEFRGVCNWPTETERTSCSAEHQVSKNGFKCPETALPKGDGFGLSDPHPKYADPSDCAKFYICLNGVTPREQGCELGLVYNEARSLAILPKMCLSAKTTMLSWRKTATPRPNPQYYLKDHHNSYSDVFMHIIFISL